MGKSSFTCPSQKLWYKEVNSYLRGKTLEKPKNLEHLSGCKKCLKELVLLRNRLDYTKVNAVFNRWIPLQCALNGLNPMSSKILWNKEWHGKTYQQHRKEWDEIVKLAMDEEKKKGK